MASIEPLRESAFRTPAHPALVGADRAWQLGEFRRVIDLDSKRNSLASAINVYFPAGRTHSI